MTQRIPPHDLEAERAVLGSVMLVPECLKDVTPILQPDDFCSQANRAVYDSMRVLAEESIALDVITLRNQLDSSGNLSVAGGIDALLALQDAVVTSANVKHHAEIVRGHAQLRRVIHAAQTTINAAYGRVDSVQDFLTSARQQMVEVTTAGVSSGPRRIDNDLDRAVMEATSGESPSGALPTGFETFDRIYGGVWRGLVQVFAGRPSSGKSAFALNLCLNVALRGLAVLYISLEDVFESAQKRTLSRFSGVNLTKILLNQAQDDSAAKVFRAHTTMQGLPFWIEDKPMTALDICQCAAQFQRSHDIRLLVVDHLGYISTNEQEYEANSTSMRLLCNLAKELDIPVALLVQLNRQFEARGKSATPQLSDLRGSGRIEEDARGIAFINRPCRNDPDGEHDPNELNLVVQKWTNGPIGTIKLHGLLEQMYIGCHKEEPECPGY